MNAKPETKEQPDVKQMLIEAHRHFMAVSVKGNDVERLYIGLSMLTRVINSMPGETDKENVKKEKQ